MALDPSRKLFTSSSPVELYQVRARPAELQQIGVPSSTTHNSTDQQWSVSGSAGTLYADFAAAITQLHSYSCDTVAGVSVLLLCISMQQSGLVRRGLVMASLSEKPVSHFCCYPMSCMHMQPCFIL